MYTTVLERITDQKIPLLHPFICVSSTCSDTVLSSATDNLPSQLPAASVLPAVPSLSHPLAQFIVIYKQI